MTDVHAVARDQLRSFIERIERLEEEKKAIADDIKDVKGEAKGVGFDIGAINAIIKLRKKDVNERAEEEAILDAYMAALGMIDQPSFFDEPYDRQTGEILEDVDPRLAKQVVDGMQTEAGRSALMAAVDIMIEREEAEERNSESPRKAAEAVPERAATQGATIASDLVEAVMAEAVAGGSGQPDVIPALTGQFPGVDVDGAESAGVTGGESAAGSEGSRQSALASELAGRGNASDKESVTVGGDESGTTASIPLTNGKFAVVDADDVQALMAYNWQAIKHGNVWYAKRRLENSDGKSVYMHRSIAAPKDGELVDHEDGDGLNNRKANLRIAVQAQNRANSGPSKNNKIGVKGVYHDAERGKWIAKVCFDYGQEVIGRFDTIPEAAAAYDERAEVLWGEFAYLNRHHVDFNVVGTESGTVSNSRSDGGLNIVHKHTEISGIDPNEDREEGQSRDAESAAANTGGDHEVTGSAPRAGQNDRASNNRLDSQSVQSGDNGITYETAPPMPMKALGYAHCFPELSKTAYQCLAGDIALNGVREPIIRYGDIIVDGWSRYNAARSLGIQYPVIRYSGKDVLIDVIGWQRSSRDWTPAQESKIAAALAKEIPHRADDIWAAFHQAPAPSGEVVAA